jgi:hypothetical protein
MLQNPLICSNSESRRTDSNERSSAGGKMSKEQRYSKRSWSFSERRFVGPV